MNHPQNDQPLILVVDDEPEVLGEVAAVLTAAGLACHCCTTTETALAKARVSLPDLIVSDINLNGRSGLEMCEQIRQNDGLADVPVMFLSGAQIPDIIRRSHAAGGTYYLRKPFDPEVLVELIHQALWMPHLSRGLAAAQSGSPGLTTGSTGILPVQQSQLRGLDPPYLSNAGGTPVPPRRLIRSPSRSAASARGPRALAPSRCRRCGWGR